MIQNMDYHRKYVLSLEKAVQVVVVVKETYTETDIN